jgi:glycosyltransferase involved in cell wall biosynthesis
LEQIKGVHILIDAIAIIKNKHPELSLQVKIAGNGNNNYVTLLKDQVKRFDLENNIEFLGELLPEQLIPLFNSALFSVVPSLWYENLPNVILESYACGTPVLASNIGSLPECVLDSQTGFLFEAGNAKNLAEKILYCLNNQDKLAEMGKHSRNIVATAFSKQVHMEKLEKLFDHLVS